MTRLALALVLAARLSTVMMTIAIVDSAPALADWSPKWSAYDGDTVTATYRLANVDTPEVRGACPAEKDLAIRARDFTRAWIGDWRGVTVETQGLDRYGRVLATMRRGDADLGEALVAAGLARRWTGKRDGWCDE